MHSPEGQMRHKREEQRIAALLDRAGINYKREHHVDFSCVHDEAASRTRNFARVDFLIMFESTVVMLEVDEGQHRFGDYSVSCDMARMARIVESLALGGNDLPILFVRYNPHAFTVDSKQGRVHRRARDGALIEQVREAARVTGASGSSFRILYMYYDTVTRMSEHVTSGEKTVERMKPCVLDDAEYNPHMAECCLPAIVSP
jgi:hypothetical protein